MKIAQITCVYPPYKGGIATSAENIARVFKSAGHQVRTFTIDHGIDLPTSNYYDVVRLKTFPGSGKGGVLPLMCRRLHDFDLIYLHYPFFGTAEIIWFLKKIVWRKKKKLVIQYHMDAILPNLFLKILSLPAAMVINSLFKNADLIVSASLDYVKNSRLKNIYAEHPEKFVEIPFGVDLEKFKPAEISHGETKFNILFVGGLDKAHYFKGIDVLLDALAKITPLLSKEGLGGGWHLEIVGEGDLRPLYERKAHEFGIADKINFAGLVSDEDLPKRYQAADCFILPSINMGEAFGIVLLEAMATGLPIIASDLPGVRGVFTSESGLLIESGNAEDLAKKINFLMDNPLERKKMGETARKEAEEKYDLAEIGRKLGKEIGKFDAP
jgi:glycosyltransferase involved in cell wall biosynthesis